MTNQLAPVTLQAIDAVLERASVSTKELRNWADDDREGPLSHLRRKEEDAAQVIADLTFLLRTIKNNLTQPAYEHLRYLPLPATKRKST